MSYKFHDTEQAPDQSATTKAFLSCFGSLVCGFCNVKRTRGSGHCDLFNLRCRQRKLASEERHRALKFNDEQVKQGFSVHENAGFETCFAPINELLGAKHVSNPDAEPVR